MEVNEWFKKQNLSENPFTLKIYPKIFIGYEDQIKAVAAHLAERHKIALISGPTGAGKTSFLRWLESNPDGYRVLYLSKPPQKPDEFVEIFTNVVPPNFLERLFRKKPNIYNLANYLNKKLNGKTLLLLMDEMHETSKDVLEWLRVLTDQIENVSLVGAGLMTIEQKLKKDLETFDQRITTRVRLTALNETETRELIKKRIENAGGKDISPFTENTVKLIYEKTGGFPREVLKFCDKLLNDAIEKNLDVIDEKTIDEFRELDEEKMEEATNIQTVSYTQPPPALSDLPYKQKKILDILSKKEWLTPTQIYEELGIKSYKTKQHGIRSMNNILNRMKIQGLAQRESRGKAFVYSLTPRVKTLFVEA